MNKYFQDLLNSCEESYDVLTGALGLINSKYPSLASDSIIDALKKAVESTEISSFRQFEKLVTETYLSQEEVEDENAWYNALQEISNDINIILAPDTLREDDIENALLHIRLITLKAGFDVGQSQGFNTASIKKDKLIKELWQELEEIFHLNKSDLDDFVNLPSLEENLDCTHEIHLGN